MSKDMLGIAVRKLVTLPGAVLGVVCDLLEKLSDPEWAEATKRFLRKEEPWPKLPLPELKVWKTVKLGVHKTLKAYREALEAAGLRISGWANQFLDKVSVSETETEVDLCVLTIAELGFKGKARYDAICKRIIEIGGQLCPNEVGPGLREQYPDQPYGEWLTIAMEPLADSDGGLRVFWVARDRVGQCLYASYGGPDRLFSPDDCVVFAVPRK